MTKIEELEKRVAQLEAEVAKLKLLPPQHHFHYHTPPAPVYVPAPPYPAYPPIWTVPGTNPQHWPTIIC